MKLRAFFLCCLVGSGLLLAGCEAVLPTPTPMPTDTPVPTATPLPTVTSLPTATLPKPTETPANTLPPAIAFALNKTQGAQSVKFEFSSGVTLVQGGKTQEIPGLALKGADSTLNRQVTISGTTTDTNELISYELVVLGADVYIKGLNSNGLNAGQWYKLPEQVQAGVRRLPTARGLISSFSPEDVSKADLQQAGTETLDELVCSVWSAKNGASAQALIGVTPDSDLRKQLGEIDATEFKIWTCADGYIHLLTGEVRGHSAQDKANTARVTLRFQMNDFDKALQIQAPEGAIAFPTPPGQATTSAGTRTGTPQATGTTATEIGTETATPTASETTAAGTETATPQATDTIAPDTETATPPVSETSTPTATSTP